MMQIRPMVPADYPAVATLTADAAQHALMGRPAWESASCVAAEVTAASGAAFIVAENPDGSVAGLAGYRLAPDGEALLYGPLVRVEGHGVGAWLESQIVALAQQDGATSFSMLIGTANLSGAAWAEWRGYQPDTEQPPLLLAWARPGEVPGGAAPLSGGPETVRLGHPADEGRIVSLYRDVFPARRLPGDLAQWVGECWVLETGGEVQAFFHLDRVEAMIDLICVDPALRRRGLATRLLSRGLADFWAQQPRKVGAAIPTDSASTTAFFRRVGFGHTFTVAKWVKR